MKRTGSNPRGSTAWEEEQRRRSLPGTETTEESAEKIPWARKPKETNGAETPGTETVPQSSPAAPDYSRYTYDAGADAAYMEAVAALQEASRETPAYAGSFDTQLNELYDQIVNRDKFRYDLNADMLYQQYKDQYVNLGQMAMRDTMGQAAALTGGYGSSYGQSVGQQRYDAYLQSLNEVVPELYGRAYEQYRDEGSDLMSQYAMLGARADDEYGKYQDQLTEHWRNVDYLQGQADNAYDRGYANWYNAYQMGEAARSDAYSRLMDMMSVSGYRPTDGELAEAGMTRQQANDFLKGWKAANPDLAYRTGAISEDEYYRYVGEYPLGYAEPASGSGGGGGGSYSSSLAAEQRRLQSLGLYDGPIDGLIGPKTRAAQEAEKAGTAADPEKAMANMRQEVDAAYRNNDITYEQFQELIKSTYS